MITNYIFYDPDNIGFLQNYLDNEFGNAIIMSKKKCNFCSVIIADISNYVKYQDFTCLKIFVDFENNSSYSIKEKEEYFNPFKYDSFREDDLISSFDRFLNFCLDYYSINISIPDNCRPILEVN